PVQMLSEDQIQKYAYLSRVVEYEIEGRIEELRSNLKINYTMLEDEEKKDFTLAKLSEVRAILGKLEGFLADYIQTALSEDYFGFQNNLFTNLITGFVEGNVLEQDLEYVEINEDYECQGYEFNLSHST